MKQLLELQQQKDFRGWPRLVVLHMGVSMNGGCPKMVGLEWKNTNKIDDL